VNGFTLAEMSGRKGWKEAEWRLLDSEAPTKNLYATSASSSVRRSAIHQTSEFMRTSANNSRRYLLKGAAVNGCNHERRNDTLALMGHLKP